MNPFSEDNLVEKTVIKLIKKIWDDKGEEELKKVITDFKSNFARA